MNEREYGTPTSLENLERVMLAIISFNEDKPNKNFRAHYLSHYLVNMEACSICSHLKYLESLDVLEIGMGKYAPKKRAKGYHIKDLVKMKSIAKLIFEDHKESFN